MGRKGRQIFKWPPSAFFPFPLYCKHPFCSYFLFLRMYLASAFCGWVMGRATFEQRWISRTLLFSSLTSCSLASIPVSSLAWLEIGDHGFLLLAVADAPLAHSVVGAAGSGWDLETLFVKKGYEYNECFLPIKIVADDDGWMCYDVKVLECGSYSKVVCVVLVNWATCTTEEKEGIWCRRKEDIIIIDHHLYPSTPLEMNWTTSYISQMSKTPTHAIFCSRTAQ